MPNHYDNIRRTKACCKGFAKKAARQATGGASIPPGSRVAPPLPMMASRRPGRAVPLTPSRMRFGAMSPPFDLLFLGASV